MNKDKKREYDRKYVQRKEVKERRALYEKKPETIRQRLQYRSNPIIRETRKKYAIKWKIDNPEKVAMYKDKEHREKYRNNVHYREGDKKRARHYRENIKFMVINHYSNSSFSCSCCGEKEYGFLTIDHINNNGQEQRRLLGKKPSAFQLYAWLKNNNYPKGIQVLCYNCNLGRARNNKVCPHFMKRIAPKIINKHQSEDRY